MISEHKTWGAYRGYGVISDLKVEEIHTFGEGCYISKSLWQLIRSTRPHLCECCFQLCWLWAEEE